MVGQTARHPPLPQCRAGPVRAQCAGLGPLAALAGLDDHVGELLYLGGLADVVEDGERFQILRHTAGRC